MLEKKIQDLNNIDKNLMLSRSYQNYAENVA